jgi:hypothetical protein
LDDLLVNITIKRGRKNPFPWRNVMKKIRQAKAQDNSQTPYTKILTSLRSAVSKDYSKVIPEETRAFVLGYD